MFSQFYDPKHLRKQYSRLQCERYNLGAVFVRTLFREHVRGWEILITLAMAAVFDLHLCACVCNVTHVIQHTWYALDNRNAYLVAMIGAHGFLTI